jgi:predicted phosphodiesterase
LKYLVLSDIHGNIDALDAVLEEALDESIDSVLVLGDLVGYGAGPNQVIDRLQGLSRETIVIRGNHDKVIGSPDQGARFNSVAREAVLWTARELTAENLRYLEQLRQGPLEVAPGTFICHGSPLDEDEYVVDLEDAATVFARHTGALTFFGHTHLPTCFAADRNRLTSIWLGGDRLDMRLEEGTRYLANPGSVGQPRDEDPRAAYFVFDSTTAELSWRRCVYPVGAAQGRILAAGLPDVLAYRLAVGL